MKKEYLTFVRNIKDLTENQEIELTIKDLTTGRHKYDNRIIKAILSSSPAQLPDGDVLWVRSWIGVLYPQPWAIKIVGGVGETLAGLPHGETLGAGK